MCAFIPPLFPLSLFFSVVGLPLRLGHRQLEKIREGENNGERGTERHHTQSQAEAILPHQTHRQKEQTTQMKSWKSLLYYMPHEKFKVFRRPPSSSPRINGIFLWLLYSTKQSSRICQWIYFRSPSWSVVAGKDKRLEMPALQYWLSPMSHPVQFTIDWLTDGADLTLNFSCVTGALHHP